MEYAHSVGLKVFINGVRAYAHLGDYYLWEDFLTKIDPDSGQLVLDDGFFNNWNTSNPYSWASGLTKFEYLREHGLLNKTIALTKAEEYNYTIAEMGYYVARLLGLAGWGYAWRDVYASGGPVVPVRAYTLGPQIGTPSINTANSTISGYFSAGLVSVSLPDAQYHVPYNSTGLPLLDTLPDILYTYAGGPWTGSNSEINGLLSYNTVFGLYLWINITINGSTSSGILHIYIDSDGSNSTGYLLGDLGADHLLEAYNDGSIMLFDYTGTGSDWSWTLNGSVPNAMESDGENYILELVLPTSIVSAGSKLIVSTVVD